MIITWNGVYTSVGEIRINQLSYQLMTNHIEQCSMLYSPEEGIVFQANWKDPRWKILLRSKKKKELYKIIKEYSDK